MIEHSQSITKVLAAIHTVQRKVDGVSKDAKNPHFKNRYASLESVVDAIRGPYLDAGLVVMQGPGEFTNNSLSVTTLIAHAESGEWIKSTFQIPVTKNDPQGAGSAQTYGQRYSLMALFNLPPVDDDGEAARAPAPAGNPNVREMYQRSVDATRPVEAVDTHRPPYADALDKIKNGLGQVRTPEQFYGLVERDVFIAAYEGLPKVGKAAADAEIAGAKKRLGIKGDSNTRAAG